MHYLSAASRMTDVNRILQFEMIGDGLQIVSIMIHVMAIPGLRRATMSAPVGCYDAETFAKEEKHLRVPIICRERPSVAENDRLTGSPIFIIDLDVLSVLFSSCDVWHNMISFQLIWQVMRRR
jgi:hypothetical protein